MNKRTGPDLHTFIHEHFLKKLVYQIESQVDGSAGFYRLDNPVRHDSADVNYFAAILQALKLVCGEGHAMADIKSETSTSLWKALDESYGRIFHEGMYVAVAGSVMSDVSIGITRRFLDPLQEPVFGQLDHHLARELLVWTK